MLGDFAARARDHIVSNRDMLHVDHREARGIARASAHAESRARVTSMGGLYDAATLHALLGVLLADTAYPTTMT